ncbi:MAG: type-4 uracil-DNA glycosylase [Candidatus Bathyarchaeales archaeon]
MQKENELASIAYEVLNCTKCPLHKSRKNAVPGEGNPNAKIMLIGEAPGYWEDIQGRPFVGAAGKFLDLLLAEIGLKRQDVFICNVLKCRPPGNREPQLNEISACTPYLDRQINALKPQIIITLGNYSTAYIFAKANIPFEGMAHEHGKPHKTQIFSMQTLVFPTFHPAAALYNAKYRKQIQEDFKALQKQLI